MTNTKNNLNSDTKKARIFNQDEAILLKKM